jgi:hypothetical protein
MTNVTLNSKKPKAKDDPEPINKSAQGKVK